MTALVLALVVLAGLVLLALRREFARLERQRRLREFVRTSPDFGQIAREFAALNARIEEQLRPAMTQMARAAADLTKAMSREDRP